MKVVVVIIMMFFFGIPEIVFAGVEVICGTTADEVNKRIGQLQREKKSAGEITVSQPDVAIAMAPATGMAGYKSLGQVCVTAQWE